MTSAKGHMLGYLRKWAKRKALITKATAEHLSEAILRRSLGGTQEVLQIPELQNHELASVIGSIFEGFRADQSFAENHRGCSRSAQESLRGMVQSGASWRELLSVSRLLKGCGLLEAGYHWRAAAQAQLLEQKGLLEWRGDLRRRQARLELVTGGEVAPNGWWSWGRLTGSPFALAHQESLWSGSGRAWPGRIHSGALRALVQGKRIAIVGPAYCGEDNAAEIDQFDLVARVGYAGYDSMARQTGSRVELSYYVGQKLRALSAEPDRFANLRGLSVILIRDAKDEQLLRAHGVNEGVVVSSRNMTDAFLFTHPNALPQLVWDIFLGSPKQIKIFNSDLFLSSSYPEGYVLKPGYREKSEPGSGNRRNRNWCLSFGFQHDPAAQHAFYKRMMVKGLVECDAPLKRIVDLTTHAYLQELDAAIGLGTWE